MNDPAPAPGLPYGTVPVFQAGADGTVAASEPGMGFAPPPPVAATASAAWQPPTDVASASSTLPRWVVPAIIGGALFLAAGLALVSPLGALVLVGFVLDTMLTAATLWIGMKVTGESGSFVVLLAIAALSSAVGAIPVVGAIASLVLLLALIVRWLRIDLWPDAILMVVVSRGAAAFVGTVLAGMLFVYALR